MSSAAGQWLGGGENTAGWLGRSVLLAGALALGAYMVVWPLSAARLLNEEAGALNPGEYLYVLVLCAIGWPFYMLAMAALSRRRRFRAWAVALSPLIGLPLTVGLLFVNVPEILAGWLFWLGFGAIVPRRPAG
jgi:hypothetical protein